MLVLVLAVAVAAAAAAAVVLGAAEVGVADREAAHHGVHRAEPTCTCLSACLPAVPYCGQSWSSLT